MCFRCRGIGHRSYDDSCPNTHWRERSKRGRSASPSTTNWRERSERSASPPSTTKEAPAKKRRTQKDKIEELVQRLQALEQKDTTKAQRSPEQKNTSPAMDTTPAPKELNASLSSKAREALAPSGAAPAAPTSSPPAPPKEAVTQKKKAYVVPR